MRSIIIVLSVCSLLDLRLTGQCLVNLSCETAQPLMESSQLNLYGADNTGCPSTLMASQAANFFMLNIINAPYVRLFVYSIELCEISDLTITETSPTGLLGGVVLFNTNTSWTCDNQEYSNSDIASLNNDVSFQDLSPGNYYVYIFLESMFNDPHWKSVLWVEFDAGQCLQNECIDCQSTFNPEPGLNYRIGVWAASEDSESGLLDVQNCEVEVCFPNSSHSCIEVQPSGQLIDGWQRISESFMYPADAEEIEISLKSNGGTCYFDDFRLEPEDASLKTYVYDFSRQLLIAELDENNYATLYDYNEEGVLVRTKKETLRGIVTIQENILHKGKRP